ncbi:MAG TPA: hypothetical protein VE423_03175 [Microvirga sp.]|nr:hypothetical protein [Microvirga sp.]
MSKITKTVTAFLMGGLALAAMNSGAAAEITTNALTPNALTPNALTPNALTPNALTPNALTPNALTPNGQRTIPSIDLSSSIESIELSNGTVVVLR